MKIGHIKNPDNLLNTGREWIINCIFHVNFTSIYHSLNFEII
jgi:hypothetical protein